MEICQAIDAVVAFGRCVMGMDVDDEAQGGRCDDWILWSE
jgi:hypothetical protein